jgi:hypothetical protein
MVGSAYPTFFSDRLPLATFHSSSSRAFGPPVKHEKFNGGASVPAAFGSTSRPVAATKLKNELIP